MKKKKKNTRKWGFKPLEIIALFSPKALGLFFLLAWEISKESCRYHTTSLELHCERQQPSGVHYCQGNIEHKENYSFSENC